jgi:hypothetical protein
MPDPAIYFPLSQIANIENWPIAGLLPGGLDHVYMNGPYYDSATNTGSIDFQIEQEIALQVPGLEFATFALGETTGSTDFSLSASFEPFRLGVHVPVTLRIDANMLRPIKADDQPDLDAKTLNISLGTIDLSVDGDWNIDLGVTSAIQIPRCMIGDSGVIIEGKLRWLTPATAALPPNTPPQFTGVYLDDVIAEIPQLPAAVSAIRMDDVFIGTGGFSGKISRPGLTLQWNGTDFIGDMAGELFGFKGGVTSMSIEFRQNAMIGCAIKGDVFVPYLNKRVGLTLALDGNGGLTATAALPTSLPAETGVSAGSAGYLINVQLGNVLKFDIASLTFEALPGNLPRLGIHGRVAPGGDVLDFPPMELNGLWIDTRGRIQTEGDGIGLPKNYIINFKGFQLEISKLGFGNNEDGGKWIGFTGGIKLISSMPAGASVEGLRLTWYANGRTDISLNGVRVNFEVPNTLKFAGEVSYEKTKDQFRGAVKLDLMALNMEVDATAVFGVTDGKPYLAIYLAAEFPAGIPLFATGLGLYGVAGLFAMNMEPNRAPSQAWYSLPPDGDWYHAGDVGCTSLEKWRPQPGSLAFGAGVTLGTIADNGHTFSGRMLLAIVFPGPILLLQGSANILRERATLADDANFRALAVLDGRAGTLQLGLDAKYRYDADNGNLIDINGSADGFFNFNDPNAWHLNVGLKEPRDRRLTARLFKLFDSYSYVMLNSQELAMGAWVGFKQSWTFGPLSVGLEAWIDANARVSWKPAHFHGDLALHGSAKLSVFGFGAGVTVDALIAADVFDPLHITGDFNVAIDLPWPLSDIAVGVNLEWGPQPSRPPFPLALKEVAIEHFKASTSWPLPRDARVTTPQLLFPNYDPNGDGFWEDPFAPGVDPKYSRTAPPSWDDLPIVPLDSRPHLTFARNVNDDALVGVNAMPVNPEFERIGDPATGQGPAKVRYGLKEVLLEKLKIENGVESWEKVARKGTTSNPSDVPTLFGSWAPVPQMPGGGGRNAGQVKLWLWSKTPFEYTRRTSRSWDEWFTDEHSDYPCQTVIPKGWDFENIDPGAQLPDPWSHPDEPGLIFTQQILNVIQDTGFSIRELDRPSHGFHRAFGITGHDPTLIGLPQKSNLVRIRITDARLVRASDFSGWDAAGGHVEGKPGGTPDRPYVDLAHPDMTQLAYRCDNFKRFTLADKLRGVRGSDYHPELQQIILVEFDTGNLSSVDVDTGEYKVLGTGYDRPTDVILTADRAAAYITEGAGTLLRVDLTSARADRSQATLVSKGMTDPIQIALDEAHGKAYVVEMRGSSRLLSIELEGDNAGRQTPIVSGLIKAFGLLVSRDGTTAYVCELGDGPIHTRLSRINLVTRKREILFPDLVLTFFLRWANEAQDSILAMQWDPDGNWLARFDLDGKSKSPVVIERTFTGALWSVVPLSNDRYVVCTENMLTTFATTLLMPEIVDVGGSGFAKHFEEEFTRWKQIGDVLEPHTKYRLTVNTAIRMVGEGALGNYNEEKPVTEFAYFRTAGPPGVARLTPPAGSEAVAPPKQKYVSSLDDLSRYVRKTMPHVVEPTPASPVPSRLAYRAYDIGLEFDENYVDLMYRLGRRDLSIHMHDGNGAIRNAEGHRLILTNQWGQADEVTLRDHEERWLSMLVDGGCVLIPIGSIVKDTTFNATTVAHLLPPSSLCEARLVPALLHDSFDGYKETGATGPSGKFGRWQVRDIGGSDKSQWTIQKGESDLELWQQKPNVTSTLAYVNAPASELPDDHQDQPLNWTDYRLTVQLEFKDGQAGVIWRYRDAGQHYRLVMEKTRCEIARVVNGLPVPLVSTEFTLPEKTFSISVEVTGSTFNVYHGTDLLLTATDSTISTGSVGFYTSGSSTAKFSDIYVDDFRLTAPVVYRFGFLSSRYKNFKDHMESFEKKISVAAIDDAADAAPFVKAAQPVGEAVTDVESRAFDGLLALVPGVTAPPVVRVTRVEQKHDAIAFLVQSPESLDWKRTTVTVMRAEPKDSKYTPVPISVLRKADGAGLMIVSSGSAPSGSFLQPGEYRLVFTYRRDNRAKDPDSDVLSEAGNTSAEEVTLELPWQTQQKESVEEVLEVLVLA